MQGQDSVIIIYKRVLPYNTETTKIFVDALTKAPTRRKNKKEVLDIAAAFDIETSLIYDCGDYFASMYVWQFGIEYGNENLITYGRTWEEFIQFYNDLVTGANISDDRKLIIYVHNLSYEFTFICRRFDWQKVFSVESHKPLFAITAEGVEFRCSYLLSGLSLDKVGQSLTMYKAKKRVGDLDYSKIRGACTPLTRQELQYCIDDIHVLLNYIREVIILDGGITKIPYTKTGYARIHTRRFCFGSSHKKGVGYRKYDGYHKLMQQLTLSWDEYIQAHYCYTGGFTHGNAYYIDRILYNLGMMDISSSYPTQLCANGYPMSKPTLCEDIIAESQPDFMDHLKKDCCIFYMKIWDLQPIIDFENLLSKSKVMNPENLLENNGRVVSFDYGIVCITEIDYELMKQCYKWSKSVIFGFRYMKKAYLPKDFIISILTLYKDKTVLRGNKDKEAFYKRQKSVLNSVYGMTVQNPIQSLITYESTDDGVIWDSEDCDLGELLDKYNNNKQRFSYYYWGIWCCKYAMKMLWDAILYLKNDYVYTDTDSVKYRNPEQHQQFFEDYNKMMAKKLELMCDFYSLPYGFIYPKSEKGEVVPLGKWSWEGKAKIFKTLGAKRYLYMEESGAVVMTTAGVRKSAVNYLMKQYGRYGIFERFNTNLVVPSGESGKVTAYYSEYDTGGTTTDYLGNEFTWSEKSCVALVNCEYRLDRSEKYIDYLFNIRHFEKGV